MALRRLDTFKVLKTVSELNKSQTRNIYKIQIYTIFPYDWMGKIKSAALFFFLLFQTTKTHTVCTKAATVGTGWARGRIVTAQHTHEPLGYLMATRRNKKMWRKPIFRCPHVYLLLFLCPLPIQFRNNNFMCSGDTFKFPKTMLCVMRWRFLFCSISDKHFLLQNNIFGWYYLSQTCR